jgi:hypothetical protein
LGPKGDSTAVPSADAFGAAACDTSPWLLMQKCLSFDFVYYYFVVVVVFVYYYTVGLRFGV